MDGRKMYELTLTENQIILLQEALEEYFYIRKNIWGGLANSLAREEFDPDKHQDDETLLEKYYTVDNALCNIFECAGKILWGTGYQRTDTENTRIAEDIRDVIHHELNMKKDDTFKDILKPRSFSGEPLPKLKIVEE